MEGLTRQLNKRSIRYFPWDIGINRKHAGPAITKLMDMAAERLAGRVLDIKKDTRSRTMER